MHKRRRSVTYDMWRRRKTRTYLLTYKHNTQVGAQPSTAPVNATLLAFCVQNRSTLQIELDRYLLPWGALQQTRLWRCLSYRGSAGGYLLIECRGVAALQVRSSQ